MSAPTPALDAIARGWRVIPTHAAIDGRCSCPKAESCPNPGKHPALVSWPKRASSDPRKVAELWEQAPAGAGVGIATGPGSDLLVIDVDPGGEPHFARLEDEIGALPETPMVHTGRGRHLYFRHPAQAIPNSAGKLAPNIDVRGEGGFVVAPGSVHKSGREYTWDPALHPDVTPLAELPAKWQEACKKRPERTTGAGRRLSLANTAGQPIPEGHRNTTLVALAGSMRRNGATVGIGPALHAENAARCTPPLPTAEVDRIARSAVDWLPPWQTATHEFFNDDRLDERARHVLRVLAQYANHKGECYPSNPTIAKQTGASVSSVERAIRNLRDAGRITRRRRAGTSSLTTIRPFIQSVPDAPAHNNVVVSPSRVTDRWAA